MNKTIKLGLTLLVVCAVAALVLAFTNNITREVIEIQVKEANEASVKEIFGKDADIEQMGKDELASYKEKVKGLVEIFTIKDSSGAALGYAIKSETSGYKSGVNTLTGVNAEGEVLGVKVISHQETSGIGTNATTEEHLGKFKGVNLNGEVNVEAVSGATKTSNGILSGVNIAKATLALLK